MKSAYIVLILLFFGLVQSCYKEEVIYNSEANRNLELPVILKINGKDCCYDYTQNSLRYPIDTEKTDDFSPLIEFQKYSNLYFEGKPLENGSFNYMGNIEINKEYSVRIETRDEIENLSLTFTNLPIVQVITPNKIFDEPKTISKIIVNNTEENKLPDIFFIGIEYRGASSQFYPKKSFGFSLKGSINLNDNISSSFFDFRKNNDWILDAMWIDKGRLRNKTSFELWN